MTDSENTFATWKEMTRTHPNQSLDTLIFLIILNSIWQLSRKALEQKFIFQIGTTTQLLTLNYQLSSNLVMLFILLW